MEAALPAPLLKGPFSNCGRGAGGVQGQAVPGHPLSGSKVVELGNACASLSSTEQPTAPCSACVEWQGTGGALW